jgi:hypothetical protein
MSVAVNICAFIVDAELNASFLETMRERASSRT